MDTNYAIGSLLEVLDGMLHEAAIYTAVAMTAIHSDKRNEAIGTLLYIEKTLPTALALYEAILTLHRLPQKGGAQ